MNQLSALRSLLFIPLFLSGCVLWVSRYDPVTDQSIQDLAKKTELTLTKVEVHREPYSKHSDFYIEAEASVRAIKMRSSLYEKNTDEIDLLNDLSVSYENLRQSHDETGYYGRGGAEGTRSILRSLLHHQLSKKASTALIDNNKDS